MSHDMGAPRPAKKSKLPLLLGILGGGFLLCAACCGGCAYFGYSVGTEPMRAATEAMNGNAAMTDKLGSPIEFELNNMQLRNMQNNNGNGGATSASMRRDRMGQRELMQCWISTTVSGPSKN